MGTGDIRPELQEGKRWELRRKQQTILAHKGMKGNSEIGQWTSSLSFLVSQSRRAKFFSYFGIVLWSLVHASLTMWQELNLNHTHL